jgi:ABC-type branched-subunit amino acid transport system permease subunit
VTHVLRGGIDTVVTVVVGVVLVVVVSHLLSMFMFMQ